MFSEYQLQIIEDNNFSFGKNKKLIPNLGNKRKCKLHYQNLKLYLNLGLQFKIQKILEFKQVPFLKTYIEHNTELQRGAEKEGNKIKKQNAKRRNSAIFGESIENPMKKIGVKIATNRKESGHA